MRWFHAIAALAVIEVTVLWTIGSHTNWWNPLLISLLSAAVGISVVLRGGKQIGAACWDFVTGTLSTHEEGLASRLLMFLAGVLLIVPGVITSIAGLVLLIPPARRKIAELATAAAVKKLGVMLGANPHDDRDDGVRAEPLISRSIGGRHFAHGYSGDVLDTEGVEVQEALLLPAPTQNENESSLDEDASDKADDCGVPDDGETKATVS
ncbi:MAG: FxsA family protein [Polyangiaceae bacterium]|nr:FxsA family protein [Polyangiaceae bacterium]